MAALLLTVTSIAGAQDYPAANFQPKVLYSDSSAASSSSSKAAEPVAADPSFPAANFQPKVVFNDDGYKHSSAAPSVPHAAVSSGASSEAAEVSAEKPAENNNALFILAGIVAVGAYLILKKPSTPKSASASAAPTSAAPVADGETGVEKYLQKQGINKTGVARYLDKQESTPATGVAKYVAKQRVIDRELAAAKTTGVERYLRDKV